ncbi:P' accessory protein [Daphne virus 1]|nr:P' accessory protein [Daphne virus 1]
MYWFLINLILACIQWYSVFVFQRIKELWQSPENMTTWVTVCPHLLIFLILTSSMWTLLSLTMKSLLLAWKLMMLILQLMKRIAMILKILSRC